MGTILENIKALFAAIRDGLLTIILILFLTAPAWINARLSEAGFVEGNVAGFTWKKDIEDNSAKLTDALSTIDTLRGQLDKTQGALQDSETARTQLAAQVKAEMPSDSPIAQTAQNAPPSVKPLVSENAQVLQQSGLNTRIFRARIADNASLLARAMEMRVLPK